MAAVALVELDVGVVLAQAAPHASHGTDRGVVGLSHIKIALAEHAVHPLVGAEDGEIAGVALVAVAASPGHVEHGLGTGVGGVDGLDEPGGVGEHLGLDLALRERGVLALLLQHHKIPPALADEGHRLIGAVLVEGAAPGGVAAVGHLVAHAAGHLGSHLRQVVDLRVAVADKENIGLSLPLPLPRRGN